MKYKYEKLFGNSSKKLYVILYFFLYEKDIHKKQAFLKNVMLNYKNRDLFSYFMIIDPE